MKNHCILFILLFSKMILNAQNMYSDPTEINIFRPFYTAPPEHIDLDKDGDPDLIRCYIQDTLMLYWIDDDDDMDWDDDEGDLDNDCLILDRNGDQIFAGPGDLSLDWVDSDNNGIADMMVIVENSNPHLTNSWDWKSNYMWIIDLEQDDNLHFINWQKLAQKCWAHSGASNFYEDYHGQTLFLKTHVPSYRFSDLTYNWENPFLFYDTDNDGLSEMSVRFADPCFFQKGKETDTYPTHKIQQVYFSFDLDNDNAPANEFDLDMTLYFSGEGFSYSNQIHRFKHMRGLPASDSLFYDARWRKLDHLVYAGHDSAWSLAFNCKNWDQCWFIFDEDDDCERWERVELYQPQGPFKIGMYKGGLDNNIQADAAGDRGEWDMDNSGQGNLYIGFDNRIHLFGAELGYWRVDFGANSYQAWGGLYEGRWSREQIEPDVFPTLKYNDLNNDGFFDQVAFDMNGDTLFEQSFNLQDYGINTSGYRVYETAHMSYDSVSKLFAKATAQLWDQAEKAILVAQKYHINYKWYGYFLSPKSQNQKYQYGYWLQFNLFQDLYKKIRQDKDAQLEKKLVKAYLTQSWETLLQ